MLNKLFSGRFLFTMITAIVFFNLSITGKLPVDKVHDIILIVIYAYFTRNKTNGGT